MTNTEKAIVTKQTTGAVDIVTTNREKIGAILPAGVSIDRYLGIMQAEIQKNPDLASCSAPSLVGSMLYCARLGLEPGVLNKIHLVPFNNTKKNVKECTVIVGYEGLTDLALRSGDIDQIQSALVYEHDFFDASLGVGSTLVHRPLFFGNRGALIGAYAIAYLKSGSIKFEVLTLAELEKLSSKSKSGYIWKDHFGEMSRKSALRKLCKHLPKSAQLADAMALENKLDTEAGQDTPAILIDAGVEYDRPLSPAQTSEFDAAKKYAIDQLEKLSDEQIEKMFARTRQAVIDRMDSLDMVRKCIVMMKVDE